ncbi:hypothetical protein MUS1_06845 [Marinomonas ushuaiensis DSM 15871]|uniref:Phosphate ABC transporter substrate-binding protein n=1 Tax=Marinomonas ushuaiensis DSM 15871 TaxID=1122207 RepID=X7E119_9GAMM|nr:hypothetical protein MUS1_06845 [Marinomonas ushuaiensis DSM 15871]
MYATFIVHSVSAKEEEQIKPDYLVFGVVPQQSAIKLAQNWIPLLNFISEKSGVRLKFSTAKDIPTFEKRLEEGAYDIAYMNPYHYVVLSEKVGFKALVHEKNKKIKGIIVANKNSQIDKLEDLSLQTLAFPAPAAFAATLIPKANLKNKNILFEGQYVNSHDAVYRNISEGRFIAGGGIMRTFNEYPEQFRNELKIIWTSDGYTPHAIATSPHVNEHTRQQLSDAFLAVDVLASSKELLSPLGMQGFQQAEDSDWDDVRSLNINMMLGQQ